MLNAERFLPIKPQNREAFFRETAVERAKNLQCSALEIVA
jgi:hypothetical protein